MGTLGSEPSTQSRIFCSPSMINSTLHGTARKYRYPAALTVIVPSQLDLSLRQVIIRVATAGRCLLDFEPGQSGYSSLPMVKPHYRPSDLEILPSNPDQLIQQTYSMMS